MLNAIGARHVHLTPSRSGTRCPELSVVENWKLEEGKRFWRQRERVDSRGRLTPVSDDSFLVSCWS